MGQGLPAMMPVRSDWRFRPGKRRVVQLGDEHGGNAVERCAFFLFDGVERGGGLERFVGDNHRGAVDDSHERAQHAAEAMIKRHGDADAILLGEPLALAGVKDVKQQIAMAEHRGLGKAGCAGSVLDVDGIAGF